MRAFRQNDIITKHGCPLVTVAVESDAITNQQRAQAKPGRILRYNQPGTLILGLSNRTRQAEKRCFDSADR
jgi:hypothetical protein